MDKCAKREVIAIIENNGQYWIGTNFCKKEQIKCPRENFPSGEGYELCKKICKQEHHAEVDACEKAGKNALGGTLYLIGHDYACDDCVLIMELYGIKKLIIGDIPLGIKNALNYNTK